MLLAAFQEYWSGLPSCEFLVSFVIAVLFDSNIIEAKAFTLASCSFHHFKTISSLSVGNCCQRTSFASWRHNEFDNGNSTKYLCKFRICQLAVAQRLWFYSFRVDCRRFITLMFSTRRDRSINHSKLNFSGRNTNWLNIRTTNVSIENKIFNYPTPMEKIAMDYKVWSKIPIFGYTENGRRGTVVERDSLTPET